MTVEATPSASPTKKPPRRRKITAPAGLPGPAPMKRKASKAAPPASMPGRKELDPKQLTPEKAQGHLAAIYSLEKKVETKKASFERASQLRRAAKAELDEANDALEREIREQRMGPGPLFNATGDGPAEK